MKKSMGIVLSSVLAVSILGGSSAFAATTKVVAKKPVAKKVVYKDGTYDVTHKSVKFGYEEAVIKIKSGKLQSVVLKRLDDKKVEVNYATWDGTKFPNLKKFRLDIAKAMVTKQSATVDAITGATDSSKGWMAAAKDALAKAKK